MHTFISTQSSPIHNEYPPFGAWIFRVEDLLLKNKRFIIMHISSGGIFLGKIEVTAGPMMGALIS
jgi:hypothetical protein